MRAVVQRVLRASVTVDKDITGEIGEGMLILVCAMPDDDTATAMRLATKIAKMRIFRDEAGKMNLSLQQTGGAALVVSQFTLAADLRGNRPGFSSAAPPAQAEALYLDFVNGLAAEGILTATGIFGAEMAVSLVNDGPVTIWIDSNAA